MKKKIKDLTLEECVKVCIKNKNCSKCELCEKHTNKCICSQLYSFKNNQTFLESEVEVDELESLLNCIEEAEVLKMNNTDICRTMNAAKFDSHKFYIVNPDLIESIVIDDKEYGLKDVVKQDEILRIIKEKGVDVSLVIQLANCKNGYEAYNNHLHNYKHVGDLINQHRKELTQAEFDLLTGYFK